MERLGTIISTVFLLLFLTLATKYYNREINKVIGLQKGKLIITEYQVVMYTVEETFVF